MEWNGNGMVCMPWYGEQSICSYLYRAFKNQKKLAPRFAFELKGSYRKGSMTYYYYYYDYDYYYYYYCCDQYSYERYDSVEIYLCMAYRC